MENELIDKKDWQEPEVMDLDVNNTEGGKGVSYENELGTYAGPPSI